MLDFRCVRIYESGGRIRKFHNVRICNNDIITLGDDTLVRIEYSERNERLFDNNNARNSTENSVQTIANNARNCSRYINTRYISSCD